MNDSYKEVVVSIKRIRERKRVPFYCVGKSLTKQADKDRCDINYIMAKFDKSGIVAHGNSDVPRYGDFTTAEDYQSSLGTVMLARDHFLALPASIRGRFQNDPEKFLAFVTDESNLDECIDLGLIAPLPQKNDLEDSPEGVLRDDRRGSPGGDSGVSPGGDAV